MSCGTFIAGAMARNLPTLLDLRADESLLQKTAEKHGITMEQAIFFLDGEIRAKRDGK